MLVVPPLPRTTQIRNPLSDRYAALVREVATQAAVRLVDGRRIFADAGRSDATLFADFCHPSAAGHALLGDAVARAVAGLRPR